MPFCPKCRDEFQDWVSVCPDCRVKLVDKLKPLPKPTLLKPVKNKLPHEKLITIARFSHPEEAYIIAARLESEGISSFVADEHTIKVNWLLSNAIGGVRLQVRESDAAETKRILDLTEPNIQAAASSEERCPKCNSANIQYERFYLRPIFVLWLLTFPLSPPAPYIGGFTLPFLKRKWRCKTCGHQWKNRS